MAYSAKAIANLLIDLARDQGNSLDQMQLQKLVYFSHGWHLAITGKPLINEEIEAWKYGPVIRSLYEEFRNCGRAPIEDHATSIEIDTKNLTYAIVTPLIEESDQDTIDLVGRVLAAYGKLSGAQLSNLTHQLGTPWDEVYSRGSNEKISNEAIKKHFISLAKKH
jgi:uncharacterized phage-associated protein